MSNAFGPDKLLLHKEGKTMAGKCRDEEHFNKIPTAFRLKARVYDFDVMCEEDESITEKTVDVEMIDYKTGHIWYSNGTRSTNFTLEPVRVRPIIETEDESGIPYEFIHYRCLNCGRIFTQEYKGQKENLYRPKYHDECGQALDWDTP